MKKISPFWFVFISLLGLLLYLPSVSAPFQFDDYLTIVLNPVIQNIQRIDHIWLYDPSRFLTHLTFAINFNASQYDTMGYHVINVIIHCVNAVLFLCFLQMFRLKMSICHQASIFSVLIFLTHPIQTSAVSYIAQRATLLTTMFYMLAILFFFMYRRQRCIKMYVLSLLVTILGIFCKPIMITVPFAIGLIDFYFGEGKRYRWREYIPHLLIVLMIPVLLAFWRYKSVTLGTVLSMTKEADVLTHSQYLFTQFHVLWKYIRLVLLPINQTLDYDVPIYVTFFNTKTVIAFLGLLAIFIYAVLMVRKKKLVSFCIMWCFLTLALESSIFPIKDVMFEHRLYLPMIGFSLLLGHAPGYLLRVKPASKYVFILLLCVLCVLTVKRNLLWADRIAFLEDNARQSPYKLRVLNSLAIAYVEAGRHNDAVKQMLKIIKLNPNDTQALNNLANTYRLMEFYDEAITYYSKGLAIQSNNASAYYFRSQCYFGLGRMKEAKADLRRAQELRFPYIDEKYVEKLE